MLVALLFSSRTPRLSDQGLRAQKLSAGVLSAALEECQRKLVRSGPAAKEYRQLETKAGANRDYSIAEMSENYVRPPPLRNSGSALQLLVSSTLSCSYFREPSDCMQTCFAGEEPLLRLV